MTKRTTAQSCLGARGWRAAFVVSLGALSARSDLLLHEPLQRTRAQGLSACEL